MESENSRILFIMDLAIMFLFFFLVYNYYTGLTMISLNSTILVGIIVIAWFLISVNSDILKVNHLSKPFKIIKDIIIAYSVLSAITIATVAAFNEFRPNDKLILYPLLFAVISSTIFRLVYLGISKQCLKYDYRKKNVLLIGSGHSARQVIEKIVFTPSLGYCIRGLLTDSPIDQSLKNLYLGKLNQFSKILQKNSIDEVIIAKPFNEAPAIKRIVEQCEVEGLRFCIVPDFFYVVPQWKICNNLGDIPAITLRNDPLNVFSNRIIKRAFDIMVSFVGLLILSPLFLIIAIAIKMTSPGSILFKQKRIGNNNTNFTLIKFRSMRVQPDWNSDRIWTTSDDQRVTPLGKILRRTNLDELPQLWNVLLGDMSIVGPRPEREYFVEKFSMEIRNYRTRHLVKSGITGLAQANGWRGNTSIKKRIENDLYYLENWSLWLDFKIIFLTFFNPAAWKNAI